jgi:hypothetical protein
MIYIIYNKGKLFMCNLNRVKGQGIIFRTTMYVRRMLKIDAGREVK